MTQNMVNSSVTLLPVRPLSRSATIVSWFLQVLVALAFLGAGSSKLAGAPAMVAVFQKVGVGQWFRLVTGTLEVVGALALLTPRSAFYGAVLLVAIMMGALTAHLLILGGNPAPAVVLLVLSATIAYLRRPRPRAGQG